MALGVGPSTASVAGAFVAQLGFLALLGPLLWPVKAPAAPQPPLPPPVQAVCPVSVCPEVDSSHLQLWAAGIFGLLVGYGLAVLTFVVAGGLASLGAATLFGGVLGRYWKPAAIEDQDIALGHDDGRRWNASPAPVRLSTGSRRSLASEDSW